MKGLSIRQPWVYAIFNLGKDIENRDWFRKFIIGQRIAIHASASMTSNEYEECYYFMRQTFGTELANQLPAQAYLERGAIVGTAIISGVVKPQDVDRGLPVSNWYVGQYGYLLAERASLKTPIPCVGKLGFWDVPQEAEEIINTQL